jgi:prolyl oligopeptidase
MPRDIVFGQYGARMQYPQARREDVSEVLHGYRVADPYRWLEEPDAPDTVEWSLAQDDCWSEWLERVGGRGGLVDHLERLVPAWVGPPTVIGERRFWTQRDRGQDHAVLWVSDPSGARPLVDPNALSEEGIVTLDAWSPSIEGDRVAYQLSAGGDEESMLWVLDTDRGDNVDGPIDRTRYSSVAWLPGGQQLYFVRRLPPDEVPAGEEAFHRRLWLHTVGTDPAADVLVWGKGLEPTAYIGVVASFDGRWLAVTSASGTAPRNEVWLGDLNAGPAVPEWFPVHVDHDSQAWPSFDRDGTLWFLTDCDAPRRRLCALDPAAVDRGNSGRKAWREVVGEDTHGAVLEDVVFAGDWIVASRRRHALSEVVLFDRADGSWRYEVPLPGVGSVGLTGRPDEAAELWLTYTDFATPAQVWHLDPATGHLDPATGHLDPATRPSAPVEPQADDSFDESATPVISRQTVVISADGTEVRVTLVLPEDGAVSTPRPAILYGYGGFGVSLSPSYSSTILAWVRAGGVYAVAHLRGGAEEGEQWHRAGMRDHKQRVFEDFEAAADALVAGGWTTTEQLAIMGGSNGGLLVGAALTRSPERYRAAVCSAPLLDMVRYERFGLGATWNDEYGRADDPTEFAWLIAYSPYHHVVEGTCYPAVLFTTFDGDTRVDPLHARKLCAALQWATIRDPLDGPVLLRREAGVGHGARAVRRSVELAADQLRFLGSQTGLELPC